MKVQTSRKFRLAAATLIILSMFSALFTTAILPGISEAEEIAETDLCSHDCPNVFHGEVCSLEDIYNVRKFSSTFILSAIPDCFTIRIFSASVDKPPVA